MAEQSGEGGGKPRKELKPDEIIDRLVPDPANPRVTRLVGRYLGNSSRTEFWRLYLTDNFDRYLEFQKEDTLDAERVSTGRIVVWLKPGSRVEETVTKSVPEEFLGGSLLSHLGRTSWLGGRRLIFARRDGPGCSEGCPAPPPTEQIGDPACRYPSQIECPP